MKQPTQVKLIQKKLYRGESARLQAFIGAIAIGDMVKSTLGIDFVFKIIPVLIGRSTFVCLRTNH